MFRESTGIDALRTGPRREEFVLVFCAMLHLDSPGFPDL